MNYYILGKTWAWHAIDWRSSLLCVYARDGVQYQVLKE